MTQNKAILVLIRHGQSLWNAKNLFTGWRDIDLSDQGREEARQAGQLLLSKKIIFDAAWTSALVRAQNTCKIILKEMGQENISIAQNQALNERDYGDLVGMDKDEARQQFSAAQVHQWRRSFAERPPGGESLKDTYERVIPYYRDNILPLWRQGRVNLIAAHGNSLRALVMELEKLSAEEIIKIEIPTGQPLIYHFSGEYESGIKRSGAS